MAASAVASPCRRWHSPVPFGSPIPAPLRRPARSRANHRLVHAEPQLSQRNRSDTTIVEDRLETAAILRRLVAIGGRTYAVFLKRCSTFEKHSPNKQGCLRAKQARCRLGRRMVIVLDRRGVANSLPPWRDCQAGLDRAVSRAHAVTFARAWSRSAIRSATSSMPTERRSKLGVMPRAARCSAATEPWLMVTG